MTTTDIAAHHKAIGGQFSPAKLLLGRTAQFGSPALKSLPPMVKEPKPGKGMLQSRITFSKTGLTISKPPTTQVAYQSKSRKCKNGTLCKFLVDEKKFLSQYEKLVSVYAGLVSEHNLWPPRACWMDIFTYKCNDEPSCWKCRDCRARFSQVALVVIAAQGNRDSLCLPHFGAVFRHQRYKHSFSIEEWAEIAVEELTMVYSQVSKQSISAMYAHLFLSDLAVRNTLPRTIPEITCYSGFLKKSACLLLDAMDCTPPPGIPVDRHLATGFRALGWVDPLVTNPTSLSYILVANRQTMVRMQHRLC